MKNAASAATEAPAPTAAEAPAPAAAEAPAPAAAESSTTKDKNDGPDKG